MAALLHFVQWLYRSRPSPSLLCLALCNPVIRMYLLLLLIGAIIAYFLCPLHGGLLNCLGHVSTLVLRIRVRHVGVSQIERQATVQQTQEVFDSPRLASQ